MTDQSSLKKKLDGKVAIVTGGASGIGEATARHFADHGARAVIIADIQDEKGEKVAESIGSDLSTYIHCDVRDERQVKALVESTVQKYGQLDIMFSNAGILNKAEQDILSFDLTACEHLFAINVLGMAACVKHAARVMVDGGVRGSIVCTASVAASKAGSTHIDYVMSKHAVLGLMQSASKQLGAYGIRVNSVSPGAIATPLACNWLDMSPEDVENVIEPQRCLKGGGALKVKHLAEAVLFLASNDSAFVTGHNLVVDGGFMLL